MHVLPETETGMPSSNPGKLLDAFFIGTTQRYLERGQDAARNLMDLNAAFLGFLNQRASSNRETLVRMMQCKDLPDLMSVESSWVVLAFDDYAREAGRLVEYNARLVGCLVPGVQEAESPGDVMQARDRSGQAVPPAAAFVPAQPAGASVADAG